MVKCVRTPLQNHLRSDGSKVRQLSGSWVSRFGLKTPATSVCLTATVNARIMQLEK